MKTPPIGTECIYRKDGGTFLYTTTRSEPCTISGMRVVRINGMAGFVQFDRLTFSGEWKRDPDPCGDCDPCCGGRPDQCAITPKPIRWVQTDNPATDVLTFELLDPDLKKRLLADPGEPIVGATFYVYTIEQRDSLIQAVEHWRQFQNE
jgi:hypothetical protein